jgi:dual specificity tyrosine-phosphorylation-regulated kinase 2/3/4
LSINLYEFIKNNNYSGISTNLIRRFAIQILRCLKVLREHKIIHCDLKPENILLRTANRSGIKIIDFGSSCFEEEKVYTYIQSRFYRAPEIMFGIPYTTGIDMWSFGCILAELYTGYPLFPGESEAEQMCCIMEVKGLPPPDMIETSSRSKLFFESKTAPKIVTNSRGKKRFPGNRPLQDVLRGADERFIHLIDSKIHLGCLNWDPTQRITPEEALNHDWIAIHIPQPSSVLSKQKKSMSRGGSAQPHQGSNKKVQEVMHTTKVLSNGSVFQIRAAPLSAKYAAKKSFVF